MLNLETKEKSEMFSTERTVPPGVSRQPSKLTIPKATVPGPYVICGTTRAPSKWTYEHWTRVPKDVPWCTQEFRVVGAKP